MSSNVKGEKLFKTKCAACHKIDRKLIGPPLNESLDNWDNDRKAMYLWVRNWQTSLESGHLRAKEIVDFDKSAMNLFPELTDEDLDALFDYVNAY